MLTGVLSRIEPISSSPPPEYKHDADRTLLPHLERLQENIVKFKDILEENPTNVPRRARLDNMKKIIEHYTNNNFQIRYDFAKIRYINNFNNDRGNKLVEKLFLSFKEFFSYFDKQVLLNINSVEYTVQNAEVARLDFDIHERSIKLCNNIITNINQLMEYIENEFPAQDTDAKGMKNYRSRCPNGTRKNKKMGKCEKKKSRKPSKSKKHKKSKKHNNKHNKLKSHKKQKKRHRT